MSVDERYHEVVKRIGGRARLVAVTKGRALEDVRRLYDLGQRDFGENRAEALVERAAALPSDARWHFIGNVQRNKLKLLSPTRVALVHSFDRPELAAAWPAGLPVLLQVDFTGRPERNGLAPDALATALAACRAASLDVRGLSTLPPQGENPRPHFRRLRELRDEINASQRVDETRPEGRGAVGLAELSMGMSADFGIAIEEGATMVRVGRALFGEAP